MSTSIKPPIGDWLNLCPVGVLVLDSGKRIAWLNPALEALLRKDAGSLVGLTIDDASLDILPPLVDGNRLVHLNTDGQDRWLQRETRETVDSEGDNLTLVFYLDVSERQRLQHECDRLRDRVEELTIVDKLTGLSNKRALTHTLNNHVTRSRRYNNALSVVVVRIGSADSENSDPIPDAAVLSVSQCLRDRLRWADNIGRYDHRSFVLMLPETGLSAAQNLVDKIEHETSETDALREFSLTLSFGISEWQKGNDARLLLARAVEAMEEPQPEIASLMQDS